MSSLFAYGSGYSATFDPVSYIVKPQVILRLLSVLFAVIVFSCISAGGFYNDICLYANYIDACNYGIVIGVLAFLFCLLFLGVDAKFNSLSNVKTRKNIVIADICVTGFWAFMWFVGFCLLTNKWASTSTTWLDLSKVPEWQRSNCRAAIAFSFFSTLTWAFLCGLAVRNLLAGEENAFGTNADFRNQQGTAQPGQVDNNSFTYPGGNTQQNVAPSGAGQRSDFYAVPFGTNPNTGGGMPAQNNEQYGNIRY